MSGEIQLLDAQPDTAQFVQFHQLMLTRIAQTLGLTYEQLTRDWRPSFETQRAVERFNLFFAYERKRRSAIRMAVYDALQKSQVLAIYDRFL